MLKDKSKNLLTTDGSLQEKAIRSGFWSFASHTFTRSLSLLKIIIVARILAPKDFGLFGISILALAIFKVFTKTGFKQSIIQNKNEIKDHLNTAWTVLVARGLFIYGVAFVSAPYLASFFGEPRAELIIRVIGLVLISRGLRNIGTVTFRKELEFRKKFVLDLSETLPAFLVTVYFAYTIGNVWALVYGTIAGAFISMITSYFLHPHRPRIEFDKEKAKDMFGFGKWILGSSVLVFLFNQGDDLFVSSILGATSLGFYQMAYRISNAPAKEITHTISRVVFPTYSKLQDNKNKLRKGYIRTFRTVTLLATPLCVGIIAISPLFVRTVLGEKWVAVILPLQILSIWGIIRAFGATVVPLFKAVGKPYLATKIQLLEVIGLFVLIYPLSNSFGITGASLAVVFSALASNSLTLFYVCDVIKMRKKEFSRLFAVPIFSSLSVGLIIYLLRITILSSGILKLVAIISFSALIYGLEMLLIEKVTNYDILKILKAIFTGG